MASLQPIFFGNLRIATLHLTDWLKNGLIPDTQDSEREIQ
jgi:hypothetical protein